MDIYKDKHIHVHDQTSMATSAENSSGAEFNPTDEELILNYLCRKVNGESLPDNAVLEFDLFGEKNPWDIWELFKDKSSNNGKDLYFFTKLKKKFANGSRVLRTIGCGSWEAEDSPKNIAVNFEGKIQCIGSKKRYRFEKSRTEQDGRWIVHEFSLHSSLVSHESGNNYVLCRFRKNNRNIQQKSARKRKEQEAAHKSLVRGLQAIALSSDNNGVVHERNGQKKATKKNRKVQAEIEETETKVIKSTIKMEFAVQSHHQEVEDGASESNTPWAKEFAKELLSTIDGDRTVVGENVCMFSNPFYRDLLKEYHI